MLPKLVAFDLDGTIWSPDMYQLWGGGAPFTPKSTHPICQLADKSNQSVRLLGDIQQILDELKEQGVIISWVSCTDEPRWANECLDLFESKNGSKLASFVDVSKGKQIFKANKQRHFEKLQKMYPSVSYNEMLFFDNEKIKHR